MGWTCSWTRFIFFPFFFLFSDIFFALPLPIRYTYITFFITLAQSLSANSFLSFIWPLDSLHVSILSSWLSHISLPPPFICHSTPFQLFSFQILDGPSTHSILLLSHECYWSYSTSSSFSFLASSQCALQLGFLSFEGSSVWFWNWEIYFSRYTPQGHLWFSVCVSVYIQRRGHMFFPACDCPWHNHERIGTHLTVYLCLQRRWDRVCVWMHRCCISSG